MATTAEAYLRSLVNSVREYGGQFESEPIVRLLSEEDDLASLKGVAVFEDGSKLHFLVVVDTSGASPVYVKYRFHFATPEDVCVFRYDASPHHPRIRMFPYHKHEGPDETVVESGPVELMEILEEIRRFLQ